MDELTGALKATLEKNIGHDETPRACLVGRPGDALVVTDKAVYILKAGFLCKVVFHEHITSVAVHSNSLEIQIGTSKHLRRCKVEIVRNEVVNFPASKKNQFEKAAALIREMVTTARSNLTLRGVKIVSPALPEPEYVGAELKRVAKGEGGLVAVQIENVYALMAALSKFFLGVVANII